MGLGPIPFSETTNYRPILLTGGIDVIHSPPATTVTSDRLYGWICNSTGAECLVTIYLGYAAGTEIILFQNLVSPNSRLRYVIQGVMLNDALPLRALASVANIVTLSGFAVRINTAS